MTAPLIAEAAHVLKRKKKLCPDCGELLEKRPNTRGGYAGGHLCEAQVKRLGQKVLQNQETLKRKKPLPRRKKGSKRPEADRLFSLAIRERDQVCQAGWSVTGSRSLLPSFPCSGVLQ